MPLPKLRSGLLPPVKSSLAASLLLLSYALLMSLAWAPEPFGYDLDESYKFALHQAFRSQLQFGRDFIYTYGPYGILQHDRYMAATYGAHLAGRAFIGLATGLGLVKLFRHCWGQHRGSVLFLLPWLFIFPNSGIPSLDCFHIAIALLPLVIYFYVDRTQISPTLALLVVMVALISLIKQTYFSLALAGIILISLDQLLRQRRFCSALVAYGLALLGFWGLAGQNWQNLGFYLSRSAEVVRGYSLAMGTPGPALEIWVYLLSAGIFWLWVALLTWQYRPRYEGLAVLGLGLVLFLIFKGAFVRHDLGHTTQSVILLVPIAGVYSALLWPELRPATAHLASDVQNLGKIGGPRPSPAGCYASKLGKFIHRLRMSGLLLAWVLLLANGQLIFSRYLEQPYSARYGQALGQIPQTLSHAFTLISGKADLPAAYRANLAAIRAQNPLPPDMKALAGLSADLYPNNLAVLFAYDLPYQGRPVLQSFAAHTRALAELNAAHLQANPPDTVLMDVATIDGRLPSSDDGLSWPALLSDYRIADASGAYLVLKRRAQPGEAILTPLTTLTAGLNQWVDLPATAQVSPLWMQLMAPPTAAGKLMNALFKLPPLYIELALADGTSEKYRIFSDVAAAGQWLSPLVKDQQDFASLAFGVASEAASDRWQELVKRAAVVRLRLVAEGAGRLAYPTRYGLRLSSLSFP